MPPIGRLKRWLSHRSAGALIGFSMAGVVGLALIGGGVYALLGGFASGSSSSINLQRGLVGWWKLDGNAGDSTPYRNNGTVTGATPSVDRKGKANGAYAFSGTSQFINFGNANTLKQTSFSFSSWVKTNAIGGFQEIMAKELQYKYRLSGSSLNVLISYNGTSWGCSPNFTTNFSANTWYHVAITYTVSGTLTAYVNGAQVGTSPCASITAFNTNNLYAATYNSSGTEPLNGNLDDLRMYNRALSAAEVAALYQQYDALLNAGSGENGLVGWWKMDGNAADSTPYRNNGTVTAATLTTDRKGAANSAYAFPGTSGQKITLPSGPYTSFGTSSFTLSSWVSTTDSAGQKCIFSTASSAKGIRFGYGNGKPYYLVGDGTHYQEGTIGSATLNDGNWHHLAIVYAFTTAWSVTAYIDGANVGTVNLPSTIGSVSNTPALLGTMSGAASGLVLGSVDDVRAYNRTPSQSEIQQQFTSYNSQININSSPTNQPMVNLNNGLAGYWPFNGNAADASVYRQNGTVSGAAPTVDRKGVASRAYNFNGTSDYISATPSPASLAAFTISAWVQGGAGNTNYKYIVHRGTDSNISTSVYFLGVNALGNYAASANGSGANSYGDTGVSAATNAWHLLTLAYDGATYRVYLDGALKYNNNIGAITNSGSTNDFTIGSTTWNSTLRPFQGKIDDLRVYNRSLSATEVSALYVSYY